MQLVGALIPSNELPLQYGYIPPGMFLFGARYSLISIWLSDTRELCALFRSIG